MTALPPLLPARYRDVFYVAAGAFGQVWRATDDAGRAVAIKVLSPELVGDAEATWRFGTEHRRLAALDHPAVPAAYEEGLTGDGRPYHAMAFVPGDPLEDGGALSAADARGALGAIAAALLALHARGLVHGDVKAANVLRAIDGAVHLIDFGAALPIGAAADGWGGTLEYMAPEQLRRAAAAPESDWYAVGCLGHRLLAGRTPFPADLGAAGLVRAQLFEAPPALSCADDPALAAAIQGLLAKAPADRARALQAFLAAVGLSAELPARRLQPGAWVRRPAVEAAAARLLAMGPGAGDVLLAGPAGAGKSQALDALRLEAGLNGRPWIGARAGGQADAPGAVVRALLRQLGGTVSPALAAWLDGRLPAAWEALEPRARRLALTREVSAALAAAAAGLVVGVDDWHAADGASRELIGQVRTALGANVRWCLAATADDASAAAPDATAVAAATPPVAGLPGCELIALPVWAAPEVAAMVAARLGDAAPAALLEALAAAGADRPGLIDGLLAYWHDAGALRDADPDAGWAFEPASVSADAGRRDPWSALWAARLAGLPADARALARGLAIAHLAGALPRTALQATLGLADAAMQTAVDALAAAALLVPTDAGLRLAPGPAAGLLLADVPAAEAAREATALARAISASGTTARPETPPADDLPTPALLTAATLALQGDDVALAAPLATAAARRALELLALADAERLASGALARMPADAPPALRLAAAYTGAEAARLADRPEAASAGYDLALEAAKAAHDTAAEARALLGLAKLRQMAGVYAEALDLAARAEQAAERAAAPGIGARAANLLARLELFRGAGPATARATCERAARLARAADAPAMLACALNLHGVLTLQLDPAARDEALAMIREAIALAEGASDLVELAAAIENLGNAHLALGELGEARAAFKRGGDLCRRHGIPVEGLSLDMNHALAAAELGDPAAIALADDVITRAEHLKRAFIRAVALAARGQALWRAGRPLDARQALDLALAGVQAIGNKHAEEHIRLLRLEAWLALGDRDAAAAEAEAAAALVAATDHAEGRARLEVAQAALALAAGDAPLAAERAAARAEDPSLAISQAALLVQGRAAGRGPAAQAALGRARSIAAGWPSPWHEALATWQALLAAESAADAEPLAQAILTPPAPSSSDAPPERRGTGPLNAPPPPLANPWAAAGAAAWLAALGRPVPPAGEAARATLRDGLAPLDATQRAAALAAWSLPASALEPATAPAAAPVPTSDSGDLPAAWLAAQSALLAAPDEAAVNERLLAHLAALTNAERGYLLSWEQGLLVEALTHQVDYEAEVEAGFSGSIAEEVLLTGEPLYLVDASIDARWSAAASVRALGLRTVVALPFATPDRTLGVVYLDRQTLDPPIRPDQLRALAGLAALAADRVAAMRREATLSEALAAERAIADLTLAVILTPPGPERLTRLLAGALATTGAERAFWLVRVASDQPWEALATQDERGGTPAFDPVGVSTSAIAQAALEGVPLCFLEGDEPAGWTPGRSVRALALRTIWCAPIPTQGPRQAVLYLDATRPADAEPRARLPQLGRLARDLARPLMDA